MIKTLLSMKRKMKIKMPQKFNHMDLSNNQFLHLQHKHRLFSASSLKVNSLMNNLKTFLMTFNKQLYMVMNIL